MKKQIITTTLAFTAILALSQAAQAQEANVNRFNFQPNKWKEEQGNNPKVFGGGGSPSAVPSGAVPSNLLGITPQMLHPAPPPRVAPVITTTATPTFTSVPVPQTIAATPIALPPAFKKEFGSPMKAVANALPKPPQAATAQPAQSKFPAAKPSSHPVIAMHHSNSLHGVMKKPTLPAGNSAGSAAALPPIASYSKGYTPGTYLPTVGGTGAGSSTAVKAKLMKSH